ncbi:MAG: DNA methyltransferase, partial [Thermoleophilia bacterium]
TMEQLFHDGFAKIGGIDLAAGRGSVYYLTKAQREAVQSGDIRILGREEKGAYIVEHVGSKRTTAKSVWNRPAHAANLHGTSMVKALLGGREFPYPKSLYAVEDALRLATLHKPEAVVVDFFAGSGTTAHAVMRLNKQDGGRRRSISVTNNEVGAADYAKLREQGLRPGDPDWEKWGICDFITKARITAVITGLTPGGDPIQGDYKFTDEFAIADGFEENVEFFTLTYHAPLRVSSNREFATIAPLLWLRAGSEGRRIEDVQNGWDVSNTYGILADLNQSEPFIEAIAESDSVRIAFIVTDEDRLFEAVVRELPDHVEPVRMYEAYLQNFEIETMRSAL